MNKKFLILLSFCFASAGVFGQQLSPEQLKKVVNGVDSIIYTYSKYATLLEDGQTKVSESAKTKFISLFKDTTSTVYGDLLYEKNVELIKEGKKPKFVVLPVPEYLAKTTGKFRYGFKVGIVNMDADIQSVKNNTVKTLVSQHIKGIKSKGLEVETQDTVAINIVFDADYSNPKILNIEPFGYGGYLTVSDADKKELEALKPQKKSKK